MASSPKIYHVYKTQCLIDGSAYFGVAVTQDPFFTPGGMLGEGEKLKEKIAQVGTACWQTTILHTTGHDVNAYAVLHKILREVEGHPLSLNVSYAEKVARQSAALTGVPRDEATKAAISVGMQGKQNTLGVPHTEESKQKIGEARKGTRWFHNPKTKEEMQLQPEQEIPSGFQLGRLPGAKRRK